MKLFISHATEDKEGVARQLASALIKRGHSIWYDEFSLTLGDSLRQSIDQGLATCDYGVVVLSKAFFSKAWPQKELNGLFSREVDGKKVILPIWHQISINDVKRHSPMLADKLAVTTDVGIDGVVEEIQKAISTTPGNAIDAKAVDSFVQDLQAVKPRSELNDDDFVVTANKAIHLAVEDIEKKFTKASNSNTDNILGIKTGLIDFDAVVGGLNSEKTYVFTGVQGVGKTSLAITITRNLILNGKSVLFINPELTAGDIASKVFLGAARISFDHIKEGYLTEAMFPRMTSSAGAISKSKLSVVAQKELYISDLHRICKKLKKTSGLDCLIIDDETSIMVGPCEVNSAILAGSETSWRCRQLKQVAQEHNLACVLTLCAPPQRLHEITRQPHPENHLWFPSKKECNFFAVIEKTKSSESDGFSEPAISSLLIKILINTIGEGNIGEIPVVLFKNLARVENLAVDQK